MKSRKLVLKKERLSDLSSGELGQVVGGTHEPCMTIPPNLCLSVRECQITHEAVCNVPTAWNTCAC